MGESKWSFLVVHMYIIIFNFLSMQSNAWNIVIFSWYLEVKTFCSKSLEWRTYLSLSSGNLYFSKKNVRTFLLKKKNMLSYLKKKIAAISISCSGMLVVTFVSCYFTLIVNVSCYWMILKSNIGIHSKFFYLSRSFMRWYWLCSLSLFDSFL